MAARLLSQRSHGLQDPAFQLGVGASQYPKSRELGDGGGFALCGVGLADGAATGAGTVAVCNRRSAGDGKTCTPESTVESAATGARVSVSSVDGRTTGSDARGGPEGT